MASSIECQWCGTECEITNDCELCEKCFADYAQQYTNRRRAAIRQWEQEHPAPQQWCEYGKHFFMPFHDGWYTHESICQACSMTYSNEESRRRRKEKKRELKRGIVYFSTNGKLIKIGKTTNLPLRMEVLGIEVVHSLEVLDYHRFEKFLHNQFADLRVKGEWFNLSPHDIEWLETLQSDGIRIKNRAGDIFWSAE